MLKYFVLLLIASTCLASEPRFHFMDCVKIKSGFYEGCKGTVEEFDGKYYSVQIDDCRGSGVYIESEETNLKPAKGCAK